ncbi:MAG TPA: tryptophan synthase subunit alpha [Dehalococcoidia bacterium]|nr:tryptophan synthase subunit alpha [Dehalococcoidia bacterium]
MSHITSVFSQGHKALIAYITVGYPSIEDTLKVVPFLASSGCDIVELGIPFSDPLADGATIQKASFYALENGVTPQLCLNTAKELSQKIEIPLVFMTYFNPVFSYGLQEFCGACASSGVSGLIIPDLPPEEGSELETITQRQGLDLIYLLAPTSTKERIELIAQKSRGFIYLVSVTGVTGARDRLPTDLEVFVNRVKQIAKQPLCVGFGISTSEQARRVVRIADGVIVGSRIIQLIETDDNFMSTIGNFIKELRQALDETSREER